MSNTIIKVENLSKRYRIGLQEKKADTFAQQLWTNLKAPIENFKRIKSLGKFEEENDSVHWALKDVSFEVKQGEVLGIIGKNGAGKSTLLKILSKITEPTSGRIEMNGRVAALLEVGTGFHPELTGRENIYMNGTILGMTKREIDRKLDEIIEFSGVEKFVDTPIKFYSSGMKVRLGFSVAAHLDPEILIIDEVLAVGDFEFQKKCLGKMEDVSQKEGRTVLFVSHNMASVKRLCTKGIVLDHGKFGFSSDAENAVNFYLTNASTQKDTSIADREDRIGNGVVKVIGIDLIDKNNEILEQVISGDWLKIRLNLDSNLGVIDYSKLFVGVAFRDQDETRVISFFSDEMGTDFKNIGDKNHIDLVIPQLNIRGGIYNIGFQLSLGSTGIEDFIDAIEKARDIDVLPGDFWKSGKLNRIGNYALINGYYLLNNDE
ncbi:ABC transporter ATP-binding protein [Fontibacter flavus]|uniref:ABC transporter ATP-binding protein n=1 Tax=Fontibacter flavus TaxID=654838 RepID=A0ABV6FUD6_9BACT